MPKMAHVISIAEMLACVKIDHQSIPMTDDAIKVAHAQGNILSRGMRLLVQPNHEKKRFWIQASATSFATFRMAAGTRCMWGLLQGISGRLKSRMLLAASGQAPDTRPVLIFAEVLPRHGTWKTCSNCFQV